MGVTEKDPQISLPRRVAVSLQFGGFFFALANVICVGIFAYAYLQVRNTPKTLEVKGSAKREITSDRISWQGTITARDPDLQKAYQLLKENADKTAKYIHDAGIADKEVTFSAIATEKVMQREVIPTPQQAKGNGPPPTPQVVPTSKVEMYTLTQSVDIDSADMDRVPKLARSVTDLIKDGVQIESSQPRYLYSKLSELKVDMLGEATKDATTRAQQIVSNANGSLGRLAEAKMGVMQINPKGVTDVSGTGNNDTTSLEKEILAVVTVTFELK